MGFLRSFLERIKGLNSALAVVGLIGMIALPQWIASEAKKRFDGQPRLGTTAEETPFFVSPLHGEPIGWLKVAYPATLCENEEGTLTVSYVAAPGAWHPGIWNERLPSGLVLTRTDVPTLSVSISAANLILSPKPLNYMFNDRVIRQTGEDQNTWTVSPKKEGKYTVLIGFKANPQQRWNVKTVLANGVEISNSADRHPLTVQVFTIYHIPQLYVSLLAGIGALVSFILTLPALSTILGWFLKRHS